MAVSSLSAPLVLRRPASSLTRATLTPTPSDLLISEANQAAVAAIGVANPAALTADGTTAQITAVENGWVISSSYRD